MGKRNKRPEGYIDYVQRHMRTETLMGRLFHRGVTVTVAPMVPNLLGHQQGGMTLTLKGPTVTAVVSSPHTYYWNMGDVLRDAINAYNNKLTEI